VSDWTIRGAVLEDEDCLVSMWVNQLLAGTDTKGAGRTDARVKGSPSNIEFWEDHQPLVEGLLRSGARVIVACDPERVTHEPGAPAVIHAWAVVDGDVVYGVGIKRESVRAGFGPELARLVLGDALERSMRTVLDLVDLAKLKMIPLRWRRERGWGSSLRQVSERLLDQDHIFVAVANHILDPERKRWAPNERRAA
jgi:hypothetical protein